MKKVYNFIEKMKQDSNVIGIVGYGSAFIKDSENINDYDFTIIVDEKVFSTINGFHFYIDDIPIDCVFKSIDSFYIDKPTKSFELVYMDCVVIYRRDHRLEDALDYIRVHWKKHVSVNEKVITSYRFRLSTYLNKVKKNYLNNSKQHYCNHIMNLGIADCFEMYSKVNYLKPAKYQMNYEYMHQSDSDLHIFFQEYYMSGQMEQKVKAFEKIVNKLLATVGGLWERGETIYHLTADYVLIEDKILADEYIVLAREECQ